MYVFLDMDFIVLAVFKMIIPLYNYEDIYWIWLILTYYGESHFPKY